MPAPTIETPRLALRPWRDTDFDAWAALCADPRVMEFLRPFSGREEAIERAAALKSRLDRQGFGWWALEVKGGPPFAGCLALQDVPFEAHFTPALEVGWWLASEQWGHGYATEGASALLRYAFEQLGRDEVVAFTAAVNVRSQRVMQRLGMTRDEQDDFDHPRLEADHPLRKHVLYRISRAEAAPG